MARHKNQDWNLPEGTPNGRGSKTHSWESIQVAILMDIRDELMLARMALEDLRSLARCYRIPRALDAVISMHKTGIKRRQPRKKKAKAHGS